ncbi:pathogenicity island effector protein [Trinickia symbiotica]|uniref:pathogenicity island effector protein n=1 Tax=Trinickia symbiotica TaxID=863227 RepID=UPI0015E64971|nr:pathogenicity island effector protein [Trinickia symbiotica]
MTTIHSSPAVSTNSISPPAQTDSTPSNYNFDSAAASIEELIFLVQKLNIDMRDIQRQFAGKMEYAAFERQMTAFETKKEAILKRFDAAVLEAGTQIASGAIGMLGVASDNEALTAAGGKMMEGTARWGGASWRRDAEQMDLDGELQSQFAKDLEKTVDQALDRANDASRQLVQTTADLVALQGRIKEAVRF